MPSIFIYALSRIILAAMPKARFPNLNRIVLKMAGAKIGKRAKIYSNIRLARTVKLVVGNDSFVGERTTFTGGVGSSVTIGEMCDISDNVHFFTGTHLIDTTSSRTAGEGYSADILVGSGVWIGYGSLILPGVTIGDKSLVAAGTVVHKSVPSRTIVGGNPMNVIRKI